MLSKVKKIEMLTTPEGIYSKDRLTGRLKPIFDVLRTEFLLKASASSLTTILTNFIQFMHEQFDTYKKQRCTKLPSYIFEDFGVGGAVDTLIRFLLEYKAEKKWRTINFRPQNTSMLHDLFEMYKSLWIVLQERDFIRQKRLYFVPGEFLKKDLASLKQIAENHSMQVVETRSEATHVIHNRRKEIGEKNSPERVCILKTRPDESLVHLIHHPSSHNTWMSSVDLNKKEVVHRSKESQEQSLCFKIDSGFLLDADAFNELMEEEDYFVTDHMERVATADFQEQETTLSTPSKKSTPKTSWKRQRTLSTVANKRVRKESTQIGESRDQERKGGGDGSYDARKQIRIRITKNNDGNFEVKPDEGEFKASNDTHMVIKSVSKGIAEVPPHSKWFSMRSVSDIERKVFPEFFDGKCKMRNEATYIKIRNFMVNKAREDTSKYMTFTNVRRQLAFDVGSLLKFFRFLEEWGLINYDVLTPKGQEPPDTSAWPITSSLSVLHRRHPAVAVGSGQTGNAPNLRLRKSVFPVYKREVTTLSDEDVNSDYSEATYHCNACGTDCTRQRYHNRKDPDFDICLKCYKKKRIPDHMERSDFVLLRFHGTKIGRNSGYWTKDETLLLLEGLELYNDSWKEVSEHVATKSPEECVLRFLQLPIEDPYLSENFRMSRTLGDTRQELVPESPDYGSQIVSYLAKAVSPSVAKAAITAAKEALKEEIRKKAGSGVLEANEKGESTSSIAAGALAASVLMAESLKKKPYEDLQELSLKLVQEQVKKLEFQVEHCEELSELARIERDQLSYARHQLMAKGLSLARERATGKGAEYVPKIPQKNLNSFSEPFERVAITTYAPVPSSAQSDKTYTQLVQMRK